MLSNILTDLREIYTQRLNKLEKLIFSIDSPNKLSPNMKRLREDDNDKENYEADHVSNSIFKKKHKPKKMIKNYKKTLKFSEMN
jgi:hypothetical protein